MRIRQNVPKWDSERYSEYKDARRGAMEDAFWPEDEPVEFKPKRQKKKRKRSKGCPENNGKNHVYIWVKHENTWRSWWDNKVRTFVHWRKTCCGCGHEATGRGSRKYN